MADMWAICAPCFPGVWLTAGLVVPNGPMDRPCVARLFLCATSPFLLGHIGPTYRTVVALMSVLVGPASLVITTVAHMGAIHRPYVLRVGRSERRMSLQGRYVGHMSISTHGRGVLVHGGEGIPIAILRGSSQLPPLKD